MTFVRLLALLLIAAGLAMPALTSAFAQDRRVPASAAELRLSYAPIVQRVQPAVVNVYAAKLVQNAIRSWTIRSFAASSACRASSRSRCSARSAPA